MLAPTLLEPLTYLTAGFATFMLVWNAWSLANASYADYRKVYIAETQATLGDVFSTFSPERIFQLSLLAAGGAFFLVTLAINPIAGLLFGIAAFFAPRMLFNIMRDKRRQLFNIQLVDGLGLLANSLRAGLTLPQAMELLVKEMKPPINQEFGRILQEYRLGTDFDEAMLNCARRLGSRDLDVLVNSVMITRRSGGNVGEVFTRIAEAIRERLRIEGKVRALASTANLQALVMASMPFALMLALYFMEPEHVQLLFSTTIGLIAISTVCILVVVAFVWIRKIMDLDI